MNAQNEKSFVETTLTDVLVVCGEEKKFLIGLVLIGTILSFIYAFTTVRYYTATTVVLPPQQQQSSAASTLERLSALSGGLTGVSSGLKASEEMYAALLSSRSLQDSIISRLNLKQRYNQESLELARESLGRAVEVQIDKRSGLITIHADDTDPKFSAELANAHVDELRKLLSRIAVTEAQQRRLFFEQQLQIAQKN